MAFVQATVVAIEGRGVFLHGPPGCGKSDLALRLIDRGALLVADDAVVLTMVEGRIWASAHEKGPGGLHVARLGRIDFAGVLASVPVAIAFDLRPQPPDSARWGIPDSHEILRDIFIPHIALAAFEISSPIKVMLALERWGH